PAGVRIRRPADRGATAAASLGMSVGQLAARLRELAKFQSGGSPVVTVYLNTAWVDDHQRERTRIFVTNAYAEAPDPGRAGAASRAGVGGEAQLWLAWQACGGTSGGVVLGCHTTGLREMFPLRLPFEDTFVVDARPYVRPLAGLVDDTPPVLVVFVDGVSARPGRPRRQRRGRGGEARGRERARSPQDRGLGRAGAEPLSAPHPRASRAALRGHGGR